MITITGPWPLMLLLFAVVVGVSMWIGYLLGRVRTLDPAGESLRRNREPSPLGTLALGTVLVAGAGVLLLAILDRGVPDRFDPAAVLIIAVTVGLLAIGVACLVRGVRTAQQAE